MKHLMLMGAVLLLLLGGCEATIGGTDGYAVEAIVFSEDGSRGSREGTPERLVVVKVFDQDTREHIPADDDGSGAYDLFGRGEWVTRLTLDGGYWRGTVVLDPAISLEGRTLAFLLLGYPDITSEQISRSGTGSPSGSSVTITTGEGFETGTAGVFGHGGINIGPAGGYIAHQNASYVDAVNTYQNGWRYLEVAPEDIGSYIFAFYISGGSSAEVGTNSHLGAGASNTTALVGTMDPAYTTTGGGTTTTEFAAKKCSDYTYNGYGDWFLPSKDDMGVIYNNLMQNSLGGFSSLAYWTSTEYSKLYVYYRYRTGTEGTYHREQDHLVRAARTF